MAGAMVRVTTSSAPSTPKSQPREEAVSTPSPGLWRHPKFDEITRRQNATMFDENNLQKIVWNAVALSGTYILSRLTNQQ